MRIAPRISIVCVLLFVGTVGVVGGQDEKGGARPSATPSETPRQFVERWAQALESGDVAAVVAFFEPIPETVVIYSSGQRLAGIDAIRASYSEALPSIEISSTRLLFHTVRHFEDTAVVSFTHGANVHYKDEGERTKLDVQTTTLLHRVDAGWKIAFEHSSTHHFRPNHVPIEDE